MKFECDFKETGKLEIEKILFESYYPVLFTCRNAKQDLFLCVCCTVSKDFIKWLVTPTDEETVVRLLRDDITIRNAFLEYHGDRYTLILDASSNVYRLKVNDLTDWDVENSIYLPTPGEYMEAEEGEFTEEIDFYTKQIQPDYCDENNIDYGNFFELNHLSSKVEYLEVVFESSNQRIPNCKKDVIESRLKNYSKPKLIAKKKIYPKSNEVKMYDRDKFLIA